MSSLVFGLFALLAARGAFAETSITPTQYTLELLLDTSSDTFTGRLIIDAKVMPSPGGPVNFVLHNNGLNISTINVVQQGGENLFSSSVDDPVLQTTTISLIRGLSSDRPVQVTIAYAGQVSSTPTGLYSFVDNGNKYYMTNFYPIYARKVFPCIDEPGTAAPITLSLLLPQNHPGSLIASTPIATKTDKGNNLRLYQLATTTSIAPYSLFFTLGQWDDSAYSLPKTAGHVKLWLLPRMTTKTNLLDPGLKNILDKNSKLNLMVNYTDKIDIFVSPVTAEDTYSGLGAVVLKQDVVINDPLQTTTEMRIQNFLKIGYALYKVFYGTLTRPSNWGDNWLATSIPLYLAYTELDDVQKGQYGSSSDESLVPGLDEKVFETSWATDSAVPYPTTLPTTPSGILSLVFSTGVNKGVYAIKTLETITAPQIVKSSILAYFINRTSSTMDTMGFANFLNSSFNAKIIGGSVKDILYPIVSQTGIPLIRMNRDQSTIYIQKESFSVGKHPSSNMVSKLYDVSGWLLPITAITFLDPDLKKQNVYYYPSQFNGPIDLTGPYPTRGWALLNVDGKGIIRVSYDVQSLMLFRSLANTTFSPATRAKLIADSFAASEAQLTGSPSQPPQSWVATLSFLEMLDDEHELAPWKAALAGFKRMWSWIYFTSTANNVNSTGQIDLATDFTSYVRQRLNNIYKKLGPVGLNEDPKDPLRREIVNAMCEYGNNQCVQNLTVQYQSWVNRAYTPSNNLFEVVACNGMRGITSGQDWLRQYQKFVNSGQWFSADVWKATFSFLACPNSDNAENSEPISLYLKNVLINTQANQFPVEHVKPAIMAIIDKPQHLGQTLNFILDNQAKLNVSIDLQAEIMTEIGKLLSSPTQAAQLTSFVKNTPNLNPVLGSAVNASIAAANKKAAWIASVQTDVQKGLEGGVPTPNPPTNSTTTTTPPPSSSVTPVVSTTTNQPPTTKGASTFGLSLLGLALSLAFLSIAH